MGENDHLKPALDASLDPVCVVSNDGTIRKSNAAFRSLMKRNQREIEDKARLLDLLHLEDRDAAAFGAALKEGRKFQSVEAPATLDGRKVRLSVKTASLGKGMGSLVCLRDSTGEVLVQAKYLKLLRILEEKEHLIDELKDRLDSIRKTLKEKIIR